MSDLDLRSVNLGYKNILTFETKREAKKFSAPHLAFVMPAANRFWSFWVIVRQSQNGDFAILTKTGEFIPIENKRWVSGNKTYTE